MAAAARIGDDAARFGLGAIARAMLAAGCTDAQIGAAVRRLDGETVADRVPATVSKVRRLPGDGETVAALGETVPKSDLGKARAALTRARGLTPSAVRVGAALLDRYNGRAGCADPSIARISEDSGVSRPGVFRALRALEGRGIVIRRAYGGRAHCNAYSFDFAACGAICGAVGPSRQSQTPARNRLKTETQTQKDIYNPLCAEGESQHATVKRKPPRKGKPPDRRQIPMMLPMDGGRTALPVMVPKGWLLRVRFDDVPGRKAVERLWTAYDGLHRGRAATHVFLQAVAPDVLDPAIAAEKHKAGQGLAVLRAGMDADLGRKRRATGPP